MEIKNMRDYMIKEIGSIFKITFFLPQPSVCFCQQQHNSYEKQSKHKDYCTNDKQIS